MIIGRYNSCLKEMPPDERAQFDDFIKRLNFVHFSPETLKKLATRDFENKKWAEVVRLHHHINDARMRDVLIGTRVHIR